MIRSLAPTVVVLAMMTSVAAANPAQTYAYISDVDIRSSGVDFIKYHCTFTVQVPRTPLDRAPEGASSELLAGATTAHDYLTTEPHEELDCTDLKHTWQLVTPDPNHKDRVSITYPAGKPDWLQRILFLFLGVILLSYAIEKLTGKSISLTSLIWSYPLWRSRRRLARTNMKLDEIRARRMPRAQVVETKHDTPPSE